MTDPEGRKRSEQDLPVAVRWNLAAVCLFSQWAAAMAIPGVHRIGSLWIGEACWTTVVFPLLLVAAVAVGFLATGRTIAPTGGERSRRFWILHLATAGMLLAAPGWLALVPRMSKTAAETGITAIHYGIVAVIVLVVMVLITSTIATTYQRLPPSSNRRRHRFWLGSAIVAISLGLVAGTVSLEYVGILGTLLASGVGCVLVLAAALPMRHWIADSVLPVEQPNDDSSRSATWIASLVTGAVWGGLTAIAFRFVPLLTTGEVGGPRHVLLPSLIGCGLVVLATGIGSRDVRLRVLTFGISHLCFALALPLALLQPPGNWAQLGGDPYRRLYFFWFLAALLAGAPAGFAVSSILDARRAHAVTWQILAGASFSWLVLGQYGIPILGMQVCLAIVCATAFVTAAVSWMRWDRELKPGATIGLTAVAASVFGFAVWISGLATTVRSLPDAWLATGPIRIVETTAGILTTSPMTEGIRVTWDGRLVASRVPQREQALVVHFAAAKQLPVRRVLLANVVNGIEAALAHGASEIIVVQRSNRFSEELFRTDVLSDSERIRFVESDVRGYFGTTSGRFDAIAIAADAMPAPRSAYHYTRDFYDIAKHRLAEGGVFCQEIPFWNYHIEELRSIVRSFTDTFPDASLWFAGKRLVLRGAQQVTPLMTADELASRISAEPLRDSLRFSFWAGTKGRFSQPEVFAGAYLCGRDVLEKFSEGAAWHTDDLAFLRRSRTEDPLLAVDVYRAFHPPSSSIAERFPQGSPSFQAEANRIRIGNLRFLVAESLAALASQDMSIGAFPSAEERLRQACQISPEFAEARMAHGDALIFLGQVEQAVSEYQRAVEIEPEYFAGHTRLANALLRRGRFEEAKQHFESALNIQPNDPATLLGLAWLLSTSPDAKLRDSDRALRLMEQLRSSSISMQPQILDVWAAALANAGQYQRATEAANAAWEMARANNDQQLAAEIQNRLALYRESRPYRQIVVTASGPSSGSGRPESSPTKG